jgi:hypothetical protein
MRRRQFATLGMTGAALLVFLPPSPPRTPDYAARSALDKRPHNQLQLCAGWLPI